MLLRAPFTTCSITTHMHKRGASGELAHLDLANHDPGRRFPISCVPFGCAVPSAEWVSFSHNKTKRSLYAISMTRTIIIFDILRFDLTELNRSSVVKLGIGSVRASLYLAQVTFGKLLSHSVSVGGTTVRRIHAICVLPNCSFAVWIRT